MHEIAKVAMFGAEMCVPKDICFILNSLRETSRNSEDHVENNSNDNSKKLIKWRQKLRNVFWMHLQRVFESRSQRHWNTDFSSSATEILSFSAGSHWKKCKKSQTLSVSDGKPLKFWMSAARRHRASKCFKNTASCCTTMLWYWWKTNA